MPVAEEPKVEWTPELDAIAKEPAFPVLNASPATEKPVEKAPEKVEPPPETAAKVEEPPPDEPPAEILSGGADEAQDDALDPEEVALAKEYGLDDADLAEIQTPTELHRAMRFAERRFMDRAKAEKPEPAKTPETKAPVVEPPKPEAKPDELDLGLNPEEVDPTLVDAFNRLKKHYGDKLSRVEQQLAEREAQRQEEARERFWQGQVHTFDALVDALDNTERYGHEDPRKRTPEQVAKRQALWNATGLLRGGMANGHLPELRKALLARAEVYAFPDEIKKQEIAKVQSAISTQSKKRTGRPQAPKVLTAPPKDPSTDPESMGILQRQWDELKANAG